MQTASLAPVSFLDSARLSSDIRDLAPIVAGESPLPDGVTLQEVATMFAGSLRDLASLVEHGDRPFCVGARFIYRKMSDGSIRSDV